jgi:hypothetical protein
VTAGCFESAKTPIVGSSSLAVFVFEVSPLREEVGSAAVLAINQGL